MLSEFVQEHSATPSSKQPIHVIYLITGVSRDANNEQVLQALHVMENGSYELYLYWKLTIIFTICGKC